MLSNWYNVNASIESLALQVYSDWTDEFSTQLKVSNKDTANAAQSFSDTLNDDKIGQACIRIVDTNSRCSRANSLWVGADAFRHNNQLSNETFTADLEGEYLLEEHTVSFGVGYEKIDIFNTFVPFSRGDWVFDSVDDYENQNASFVSYSNAFTGNSDDAGASFSIKNFHAYLEDKWDITDTFWVNAGVRYEQIDTSGLIRNNAKFYDLYKFSNTNWKLIAIWRYKKIY